MDIDHGEKRHHRLRDLPPERVDCGQHTGTPAAVVLHVVSLVEDITHWNETNLPALMQEVHRSAVP